MDYISNILVFSERFYGIKKGPSSKDEEPWYHLNSENIRIAFTYMSITGLPMIPTLMLHNFLRIIVQELLSVHIHWITLQPWVILSVASCITYFSPSLLFSYDIILYYLNVKSVKKNPLALQIRNSSNLRLSIAILHNIWRY